MTIQEIEATKWMGGQTIAQAKVFIKANKLKLRAGSLGILDTTTLKYEQRPLIECWVKSKRRYLPFEFSDTHWFSSREERDAVLEAITA